MLVTGRLEIDAPILVLLTVLCAGVPVMTLNGGSRLNNGLGISRRASSPQPALILTQVFMLGLRMTDADKQV
jgi:hypothetical protein